MEYRYARDSNFADLASGHVFYSLPGHPAFPVRLASEIYQRCLAYRGRDKACTIYDPCCGAAYALSVIAYLHWDSVCRVIGSDIDEKAVQAAGRNFGLLTPLGMERRGHEISAMLTLYGKDSHRQALASAHTLLEQVICLTNVRPMQVHVFQADATDPAALRAGLEAAEVDIVLTDIPYGLHSTWQGQAGTDHTYSLLDSLLAVVPHGCIVAISSDKDQKLAHEGYERLEKFQVGKRQVAVLRPA